MELLCSNYVTELSGGCAYALKCTFTFLLLLSVFTYLLLTFYD